MPNAGGAELRDVLSGGWRGRRQACWPGAGDLTGRKRCEDPGRRSAVREQINSRPT